jgi:hypothetical protein
VLDPCANLSRQIQGINDLERALKVCERIFSVGLIYARSELEPVTTETSSKHATLATAAAEKHLVILSDTWP